MYQRDDDTESGGYYYVNEHRERGRPILRRRPRSPLTSPPLPSDFDAYTQATTAPPAAGRESWAPTSTPLDDDFDAITYTASPNTADISRQEYRRTHGRFRETGYRTRSTGGASEHFYGLDPTAVSGFRNSAEYAQYMEEMEQIFGGTKDVKVTEKRMSPTRQESKSSVMKPPLSQSVVEKDLPPRSSGTDYEVIKNHVVEDGPERTVTISTWRERVAKETMSRDVEMSVYYLNADDYAKAEELEEEPDSAGAATEVDSHVHQRMLMSPLRRTSDGSTRSRGNTKGGSNNARSDVQTNGSSSSKSFSQCIPRNAPRGTPPLAGNSSGSRSSSFLSKSAPHRASPLRARTHLPSPPRTPSIGLRSSTPIRELRNLGIRTPSPAARLAASKEKKLPSPPFHPTRSGSTISSIKSDSKMTLEAILSSCKPSLLHVLPILKSLGIHTEDHLKAVSNLSEETRDREVRDVALKKGMSVMEWAILLDRLLSP